MNSTEAQQEAVRRFGLLGAVIQHFQGAAKPFWVGTAMSNETTFSFHCFGRGESWETAFADAATKQPAHFHAMPARRARR